jgi:uncharacterized LabA/DUF88 family protein
VKVQLDEVGGSHLLTDSFNDRCDVAFIVSGDSDIVPPMKAIRSLFPQKKLVAAFPPHRTSNEIIAAMNSFFYISKTTLGASQFPDVVISAAGFQISRPTRWG